MRFIYGEVAIMDRVPASSCACGKNDWGNTTTVYAHGAAWLASTMCLSCLKTQGWTIDPDKPVEWQSVPSKTHMEGGK